jgi:hypothetical protein
MRHKREAWGLAQGVDLVTRQPVALKKVHAEVLDEDSVTFLMREVTLLRGIDHPNVLKLIDVASSSEKQTIFLVRFLLRSTLPSALGHDANCGTRPACSDTPQWRERQRVKPYGTSTERGERVFGLGRCSNTWSTTWLGW